MMLEKVMGLSSRSIVNKKVSSVFQYSSKIQIHMCPLHWIGRAEEGLCHGREVDLRDAHVLGNLIPMIWPSISIYRVRVLKSSQIKRIAIIHITTDTLIITP